MCINNINNNVCEICVIMCNENENINNEIILLMCININVNIIIK